MESCCGCGIQRGCSRLFRQRSSKGSASFNSKKKVVVKNPLLKKLRETCDAMLEEETNDGRNQPLSTWNVELATIHQSISRLEELAGITPASVEFASHWPVPTSMDQEEWSKIVGKSGTLLHVRICYGREEDSNEYEVSYGRLFVSTAGLYWVPAAGEEIADTWQQLMRWMDIVDLAKGDDNALGVVEDDQIQISLKSGRMLHLLLAMPRFVPEDLSQLREIWHNHRNDTDAMQRRNSHRSGTQKTSLDSATPSFVSATAPERLPLAMIPPEAEPLEAFVLRQACLVKIAKALKSEDGGPLRRVLVKGDVMGAFDMFMSPWVKAKSSGTLVRRLRFRIRLPPSAAVIGTTTSAVTDILRFRAEADQVVLVSASCTHDVPFVGNKFRVEVHYVFSNDDSGGVLFRMFVNVEWLEDLSIFCPVSRHTVVQQTEDKMRNVAKSLACILDDEAASAPTSPRVGPITAYSSSGRRALR